jgi:hypothetical protein
MIDGQEWFLAEPRVRLVPADSDVGFEVFLSLDDDGTFNDLVIELQSMQFMDKDEFQKNCTYRYAATEIKLGRMMLERNYTLDMEHLRRIFQVSHDAERDPVANGIREAVTRIVAGDAPKTSADGDEQSPTLSAS